MQKYQLIRPRFLLDQQLGELSFDGQNFLKNDGHFPRSSLVGVQVKYRLLGPLLLWLALASINYYLLDLLGQLLAWLVQTFPWLSIINPPTRLNGGRPFLILLAPIMALALCANAQPFSYLQLRFADRDPLQLSDYSGLLDQLQLQPPRRRRRLLTIAGWLLLSLALVAGQWPRWQAPDENFPVCIQGKDGPQLERVSALRPEAQLCEPPLSAPINSDYNSFHLTDAGDYWSLMVQPLWNEPLEYRYRLSNGTVQPLQWREDKSLVVLALLVLIYTAPLMVLVYLLWRGLLVHRRIRERFAGQ